jgi:hypothetical protein
MNTLVTIGVFACVAGWAWLTWKLFEDQYVAAKKAGGPEWLRVEKITTLSVIGAALVGGFATAGLLMWLELP